MRNKHRRSGIILMVLFVLAAGFIFIAARQHDKNTVTLSTARVERGTVTNSVSGTGTLQPLTTVEVKSNVGGTLISLGVDEGDTVKAGQVLARIDPADAQNTLEQSQADMVSAHSKVMQAQQSLTMQRLQDDAQLRSAAQSVETARLKLTQAKDQAGLQRSVNETSIDQAQQNLASAQAKLAQAEEQARLQPTLTDMAIAQAKSSLNAAKTAYQQTKTALVPQAISAAQATLGQAKANHTYAESDLARQQVLQAKGYVAHSDVDAAQQRYAVAKAALDSAQDKCNTIADQTHDDLEAAQAKVEQAELALHTAEANRAQDTLKQHDVVTAQAAVKQVEAALRAAKANAVQNKVKDDDVATAQAALKQAQAALDTARANSLQSPIKQGDITQANAQVKRSEAAVTNAVTNLNYTTITAPRAGIVIKKYVEVGSVVAGGRTSQAGSGSGVTLLDIADVSRMYALVNIDETDIAKIQLGQEVDVSVDAYTGEVFNGKVTKIAPQTTTAQNVTTIAVTVEVEAPDLRLKPGMNSTCKFVIARHSDVLTVPNAAVKHSDSGATISVIKQGKPVVRRVQTGLLDSNSTEILDGVQEGEQVVTSTSGASQQSTTTPTSTRRGFGGPGPGGPPPF